MNDPEDEQINQVLGQLSENWECVQILVSRHNGSGTEITYRGSGNFYARKGMAQDFIDKDRQDESASKIAEKLRDSE